jgi:hypothetical protein
MYYLPFTDWFWHYGIRTALIPVGLGATALLWRARHSWAASTFAVSGSSPPVRITDN